MARPAKKGLDYFPLDVGFLRDKKVRLLRAEFGASSVLFVLYVFCRAYEEDGYFLRWDKEECLLAADELKESPTYISEVLQGCLSRSLFDEGVFQMFGVLTSAGIQRRYLRGCEKRDDIQFAEEYFLLDVKNENDIRKGILAKLTFFRVSGELTPINSPETIVNSPETPQSKVKESKVKERTPSIPLTGDRGRAFSLFWEAYPKKVGKTQARKAFEKLKPDIWPKLVPAVELQKRTRQWTEDDGRFIPHPATWLNRGQWEDDVAPDAAHGSGGAFTRQDDTDKMTKLMERMQHE